MKGLTIKAPEGLKKELADLAVNVRKDQIDFNVLKKLKRTENELVERCLLINFKTVDELKQLFYFILTYYEPILDTIQKLNI